MEVDHLVTVRPLNAGYEQPGRHAPDTLDTLASAKGRITYIGGFVLCYEGGPALRPNQLVDLDGWIFRVRRQFAGYHECDLHYLKPEQRRYVKRHG